MNFKELKAKAESINAQLTTKLKENNQSGDRKADERLWYPAVDKAGNGTAVVRFLPAPAGEDMPYVTLYTHEFKDPNTGRWYIENSLSTIGKPDPVGNYNRDLWKTGIESNKEICRRQKRKTYYFANVLVIKDSINPENEGKVKIFKFGRWMYKFIEDKLIPQFEGEQSVPVFDLWKGASFRIRIGMKGEHRNYDRSEWDQPSQLFASDDKMEEVWLQAHSLKEFTDISKFKDFDDLDKHFKKVIGIGSNQSENILKEQPKASEPKAHKEIVKDVDLPYTVTEDDSDDDFFAKLAQED